MTWSRYERRVFALPSIEPGFLDHLPRVGLATVTCTVQFRSIRHHVTFFKKFPTNLQKKPQKSRENLCRCQRKSAVTRDRRID